MWQVKFLGVKDTGSRGCPGEILFEMLMEVLADYGLDIHNMVGLGTNGFSLVKERGCEKKCRIS